MGTACKWRYSIADKEYILSQQALTNVNDELRSREQLAHWFVFALLTLPGAVLLRRVLGRSLSCVDEEVGVRV